MRKPTNKLKIEKCECGKTPELVYYNKICQWVVICPHCHKCSNTSIDPMTTVKSWNKNNTDTKIMK